MREIAEYAVYKGDTLLCIGTVKECAAELNVLPETIKFYTTPTYQRRLSKRKNPKNYRTVIKIEDEEEVSYA
jgi:hypothetical protein